MCAPSVSSFGGIVGLYIGSDQSGDALNRNVDADVYTISALDVHLYHTKIYRILSTRNPNKYLTISY